MNSSDDFGCIFEERTGDIAFANADYIVNAANATGYMGGFQSRLMLCKGVAESINYHTKGKAEKEAKKAAKEYRKNKTDTSLYFTSPCGLNCKQKSSKYQIVWESNTMGTITAIIVIIGILCEIAYYSLEKCEKRGE